MKQVSGKLIKAARENLVWTQAMLAKELGITQQSVNQVEQRGVWRPTTVAKLDRAFGGPAWRAAVGQHQGQQMEVMSRPIGRDKGLIQSLVAHVVEMKIRLDDMENKMRSKGFIFADMEPIRPKMSLKQLEMYLRP